VHVALFDAAHGTAPDIAGKDLANPTAIFLALVLLLYQVGEISVAKAVKGATLELLRRGTRTRDLGGTEGTMSFTAAVAGEVRRMLQGAPAQAGARPVATPA
jgi:isocitrate dehydrogenase (NAD+)